MIYKISKDRGISSCKATRHTLKNILQISKYFMQSIKNASLLYKSLFNLHHILSYMQSQRKARGSYNK